MSRWMTIAVGWALVPATTFLIGAAGAAFGETQDRWGAASVAVGDSVPDVVLRDMENREIRLSALRGTTVLLNFWVSWCEECREQAPLLRDLYERYRPRGLALIGVSYDADRERAEDFRREYKISWPVEFTGRAFWENRLGRMFRVEDTGAILLIGANGVLEGDYRDLKRLEERLSRGLPPPAVSPPSSK